MAMFSRRAAADFLTSLVRNQRFRFWRDTRAAATALMGVAVVVMSVGAGAYISDHLWIFDQRDKLKSATDAASVAAMVEMNNILLDTPDIEDQELHTVVEDVARRFVTANFADLPPDRYAQAVDSLQLQVTVNREESALSVQAEADLGGYLFSSRLPLLSGVTPVSSVGVGSGAQQALAPTHVVLAIDTSRSMQQDLNGDDPGPGEFSKGELTRKAAMAMVDFLNPNAHNQIAVGLVPWDALVKLNNNLQQAWNDEGWAEYPQSRRYGAAYVCRPISNCRRTAVRNEDLPANPPDWAGCLNEQRVDVNGHAARPPDEDLLDHPSTMPFAEGIYTAALGYAYKCQRRRPPHDFGVQYCYGSTQGAVEGTSRQGAQSLCKTNFMRPLSSDATTIKGYIDRLSFEGPRTYSALGVLWAQRMLMHQWADVWDGDVDPVDPSQDGHVRRVIVLFTDGTDTQCGPFTFHRNCTYWDVGLRRSVACEAAKAAGTEIFVVAAMRNMSSAIGRELRDCSSSDPDSDVQYTFKNIRTDDDIAKAFATIGLQLKTLRRTY